ncbi:MAG TPA: STAS domain-containing protein, partial [Burkholderiaceae bacterium]
MLLLPATVTAREANDVRRLLTQALKGEPGDAVVIDASNLQQFDSAALAVLLECQRAAQASGKSFELRGV